jgi:hypothetical protein
MSRIPPHGARLVGAWGRTEAPQQLRSGRAVQAEPVELVESVERAVAAPSARRGHPHLVSLGRRLHLVH